MIRLFYPLLNWQPWSRILEKIQQIQRTHIKVMDIDSLATITQVPMRKVEVESLSGWLRFCIKPYLYEKLRIFSIKKSLFYTCYKFTISRPTIIKKLNLSYYSCDTPRKIPFWHTDRYELIFAAVRRFLPDFL